MFFFHYNILCLQIFFVKNAVFCNETPEGIGSYDGINKDADVEVLSVRKTTFVLALKKKAALMNARAEQAREERKEINRGIVADARRS